MRINWGTVIIDALLLVSAVGLTIIFHDGNFMWFIALIVLGNNTYKIRR